MKPYVGKMRRRLAATKLASANFAIGTASAFVLASAVSGLLADRPAQSGALGGGWMLRGALAPTDRAVADPPAHAAGPKTRRFS